MRRFQRRALPSQYRRVRPVPSIFVVASADSPSDDTATTFSLQNIKFSNDGKLILLIDKELFKIAYPAVV